MHDNKKITTCVEAKIPKDTYSVNLIHSFKTAADEKTFQKRYHFLTLCQRKENRMWGDLISKGDQ